MQLNNRKILIIRLSSIGDTVHTLPVAGAIKHAYPDAKVHWLVEPESAFLLQNNKAIDKVFIFDKKSIKKGLCNSGCSEKPDKAIAQLLMLGYNLRLEKYDIAIDVQGLFKSGVLTAFSGAKRKIGFAKTREFAELFLDEKINAGNLFDPHVHVIHKNLKLVEHLGIKKPPITYPLPDIPESVRSKIDELLAGLNPDLKNVAIVPSTLWSSKYWDETHWQQLLEKLSRYNNIIMLGTAGDDSLNRHLTKNLPEHTVFNLAGKTTLLDLLEIYKRMNYVIGVDTGPLHLAVAVNKPKVIGLYGPTSPGRTGALGHTNLSAGVQCQPCNKKLCPIEDKNYMRCMKELKPSAVIKSFDALRYK